ncbi:MAG: threonine/serine dehydratase [Gemmatimonadota bacterium]
MLDLDSVQAAARRIAPHVFRTPVLRKELGSGATLFLKPENLQVTGSFKVRGAFNRMLLLPAECRGIVAHSSGNHARAVAHAGRVLAIPTTIVVPSTIPAAKRDPVVEDGATVVTVGPDSEERKERAIEIAAREGLSLVAPYDDFEVMAGQGTMVVELLEDAGALDRLYAPVSGGGLIAGCATAFSALGGGATIGVEPESADDTRQSLAAGRRVGIPPPETIADGLCVRIPGEKTWPIVQAFVSRVETVTDEEIRDAMAFALHRLKLVVEPSGAASLACALREGEGRCGVILSGGNVEPTLLAEVADGPRRW